MSDLLSPRFLLWFALGVALLAHISVLRFDFVYDDYQQIQNNPAIRDWGHVPHYFTSNLWANAGNDYVGFYYRPLFLVWLRLNYFLFHANAPYWHATSLLLHLVV